MNTTVKGAVEALKDPTKIVKNGFQTVTKIEFDGRRLYTVTHADGTTFQVEDNVPFFSVFNKVWDPTAEGMRYLRYSTRDVVSENTSGNVYRDSFEDCFGVSALSDARWALLAHYWISGIILEAEINEWVARLLVGDTKTEA